MFIISVEPKQEQAWLSELLRSLMKACHTVIIGSYDIPLLEKIIKVGQEIFGTGFKLRVFCKVSGIYVNHLI